MSRAHKERAQPRKRKHLGLLEKHKDYVKRARNFNSKKRRLRALQARSFFACFYCYCCCCSLLADDEDWCSSTTARDFFGDLVTRRPVIAKQPIDPAERQTRSASQPHDAPPPTPADDHTCR